MQPTIYPEGEVVFETNVADSYRNPATLEPSISFLGFDVTDREERGAAIHNRKAQSIEVRERIEEETRRLDSATSRVTLDGVIRLLVRHTVGNNLLEAVCFGSSHPKGG